jgi:hypothetical protein
LVTIHLRFIFLHCTKNNPCGMLDSKIRTIIKLGD